MSVKLITGYTGTAHINSDDVMNLLVGIGGFYEGRVLPTHQQFKATVNSANSVTIGTGDALIASGCHVRVPSPETVTIESGAQGMNRNDLIALRYTKSSTNVESASMVVINGTPTSGTASDPSWNKGTTLDGSSSVVDFPLWRIPISGVNVGTPVKLFTLYPTAQYFYNQVTLANSDTGVVTVYKTSDGSGSWEVKARRVGHTVELWCEDYGFYGISTDDSGNATYRTLYPTLPAQYRPKYGVHGPGSVLSNDPANANWQITSDGQIKLWASDTGGRYFLFHATYLAAD